MIYSPLSLSPPPQCFFFLFLVNSLQEICFQMQHLPPWQTKAGCGGWALAPHAVVGGGLCENVYHETHFFFFFVSFTELVKMVMNGWRRRLSSLCLPTITCTLFFPPRSLLLPLFLHPFPWIGFNNDNNFLMHWFSTFNLKSAFTFQSPQWPRPFLPCTFINAANFYTFSSLCACIRDGVHIPRFSTQDNKNW